jgi:hypothetical protein
MSEANPGVGRDLEYEKKFNARMAPKVAAPAGKSQQNINVNQNLHFQHDGKDHKKTGDSTHKAVKDAFRQMSAQGQGS